MFLSGLALIAAGCGKQPTTNPPAAKTSGSQIQISATANGTLVATPTAEFTIAPNGYVAASLVSGGRKLSLDDAGSDSGIQVTAAGKRLSDVVFD
ncbi:MAG TPA: hypothetical protein VLW83_05215, partial [Candidatus Acidoferrales bacterium]|nr:hypothetical protein [Candidatus Acidoferrales bacterium]